MGDNKSVFKNVGLSSINTLVTLLFSLITFPYVSRILSVEGVGAINFSNSIIGYLSLGAALGMGSFAVRSGSRIKKDRKQLEKFAGQVFSINCIATFICFCIMVIVLILPTKISNYSVVILIQSLSFVTSPMTLTWLYSIYEDFKYITIRNITIKIIMLILVLIFVRNENDVIQYVLICGLGDSVANIVNFIHSRKYIHISFTFSTDWKIYRKSIGIFFINSLATTLYLNSDITMLGLICGDRSVGYYSVSTKIYNILKQIINAGIIAALPRLAFYASEDEDMFKNLVEKMINFVVLVSLPITVGIFILNKDTVLIISGEKYLLSTYSLLILSTAIPLTMLANIFTCGVLISYKKEKIVMITSVVSAIVNVALNLFLIPYMAEIGASITTLIAELIVLVVSYSCSKKYIRGVHCVRTLFNSCLSCVIMVAISQIIIRNTALDQSSLFIRTLVIVVVCIFVYSAGLILLHDENMKDIKTMVISRFNRHVN